MFLLCSCSGVSHDPYAAALLLGLAQASLRVVPQPNLRRCRCQQRPCDSDCLPLGGGDACFFQQAGLARHAGQTKTFSGTNAAERCVLQLQFLVSPMPLPYKSSLVVWQIKQPPLSVPLPASIVYAHLKRSLFGVPCARWQDRHITIR